VASLITEGIQKALNVSQLEEVEEVYRQKIRTVRQPLIHNVSILQNTILTLILTAS
jgi:hypothetical protein